MDFNRNVLLVSILISTNLDYSEEFPIKRAETLSERPGSYTYLDLLSSIGKRTRRQAESDTVEEYGAESSQRNSRYPEGQHPPSRRDSSDRRTGYIDSKSSNRSGNSYKNSRGSGNTGRRSGSSWWFGERDDYADDIIVYRFYNGGNGKNAGDVGSTQNRRGYQQQYGSSIEEFHGDRYGSGSNSRGDSKYGSRSDYDTMGGSDYPSQKRSSRWLFGERDDYADEILVYRFYNGGKSSSIEEVDSIPSRRRDQIQKGSSGGDLNIGRDSKIQYQRGRPVNSNHGSGSDFKTIEGSGNHESLGSTFVSQGGVQDKISTRGDSDSTVQYKRGKPVGSGNYESGSDYETTRGIDYTARNKGSTWWFGERDDYVDEILVYRFYNGGNIPRVEKVEDIPFHQGHHDKQESSGNEYDEERPVGENSNRGQDSNNQYSGSKPVGNRNFGSGSEYETRVGSGNYGSRRSSFESHGGEIDEVSTRRGSDSTTQNQKGRPVGNRNYESESNYGNGGGSNFPPPRKGSSWWFDDRDDYADDIIVYRFYNGRYGGSVGDVGNIQKRRGYQDQQERSGSQYQGEKPFSDNTNGGRGSTNQYQGGTPVGSGNYKSRSSTLESQEKGPIGNSNSGSRDSTNKYEGERPVGRNNYNRGGNGYETIGRSGYTPKRRGSRWWFGERDDYVDEILVYRFYNGGNISSRISTLESVSGRKLIGSSSSSTRTETREDIDPEVESEEVVESELIEYESSDMSDRLESMGDENGGYTVTKTSESKPKGKVRSFRYYTKFLEVENEDDFEEFPGPTATKYTRTGRTKRKDKILIEEIKRKLPRTADYSQADGLHQLGQEEGKGRFGNNPEKLTDRPGNTFHAAWRKVLDYDDVAGEVNSDGRSIKDDMEKV